MSAITKKEKAIAAIEIAGVTNDQTAFLRLYTEHRISFPTAKAAFEKGLKIGSKAGLWK